MARIQIESESIYYTRSNARAATAIVFIHGSGGNSKSWPEGLRKLKIADVILLDLPGHGLSSGTGRNSVEAYSVIIDQFIRTLDLNRVILAGHSLGGAIVLASALERPAWLSGLVLVGTGVRLRVHPDILKKIKNDYPGSVDLICSWAFGPSAPEQLVEGSKQALLGTAPEVTLGDFTACNRFDVSAQVSEINYPTLVLAADHDRLTPPKYGLFLHQQIRNSTYRLIDDAGHMMASEKPQTFLGYITQFLER